MTSALIVVTVVLASGLAVLAAADARDRWKRAHATGPAPRRILFPFAGHGLSSHALDAALRLAVAEGAVLVPVFLARVPLQMPLDSPLPRQCTEGMPLLETIEQRAMPAGVLVDSRIERGRTFRHALREAIAHERYDQIIVAAASARSEGFHGEDIAWLLDHAPGDVVIIRPEGDDLLGADARRNGASLVASF
jgi:nucleotide-binding universal stress UspA family protein